MLGYCPKQSKNEKKTTKRYATLVSCLFQWVPKKKPLNDDTKIFTEIETDTFFPRPNSPRPKLILFFSKTKFSETKTETFFPRPDSPKPIPKPCNYWQKSRDQARNWDFSMSLTILQRSSPNVFLLFLLCFSTPPEKRLVFKNEICTVYLVEFLSCYFDFFFSETTSEIFFSRPNFPRPKPFSKTKFSETKTETFLRDQIFRNRDFFSETKFSKTETFFRDQILQNQNRNPQQIDKSLETKNFRNRNVNLW